MADMTLEEQDKVNALTTAANNAAATAPQTNQVNAINQMYDAQKQSQLNQLNTAYELNKQNQQAAAEKIPTMYQEQANSLAAQYEKNKRNFNQQAAISGLNTGTASQAELAQNAAYQRNYGALRTAEADAQAEAERNMLALETQYKSDINAAIANNDYTRAAALLDEYNNQEKRDLNRAQLLAGYGDFSGYANLPEYGQDVAKNMSAMWYAQNPDLAYTMGYITNDQKNNIKAGKPINEGLDENGNKIKSSGGGGGYYYTSSSQPETSAYDDLLGAISNARGANSTADYKKQQSVMSDARSAVNDALAKGEITSSQAKTLTGLTRSAVGAR